MGLKNKTKIVQTKNAATQYVTIPSAMVQDSQYPFKDAGEVVITFEPESQLMIVSRDDIDVTSQDLETLIKKKVKLT